MKRTPTRRVVFITGAPVVWGAEMSMIGLAAQAPASTVPVLICSNPDLATAWRSSVNGGVQRVSASSGRIARNIGFLRRIPTLVRRGDRIVVFDFYLMPAIALLTPLLLAVGVRVIVDIHDGVSDHPRRRPFFALMKVTHRRIAVSRYIANQTSGLSPAVVYRAVGEVRPARRHSVPANEPLTIGIVGQIHPSKGIEFALRTVAASGLNVSVRVRGGATEENREFERSMHQIATELLGDKVVFEGSIARAEVMAGLDIVLCCNADEPFGRVMVEAQLAGAVVVAPASGGALEIIENAVSGFLYVQGDLRDAIRVLREAAKAAPSGQIAHAGRASALKKFDPARQAERYYAVILDRPTDEDARLPASIERANTHVEVVGQTTAGAAHAGPREDCQVNPRRGWY